uniref:Uncharacterized protein n=1 Tax=Amphimedon queenslandica TaxID=400682 RepID=A0A1X7UQT1_AMPQE
YCISQDIEHGDMVACDNEKCPIDRFHCYCVGLTDAPVGSWYCKN